MGPFSAILGLDFLQRTQMRMDLFSRIYRFAFALNTVWLLSPAELHEGKEPYLQHLCVEVADLTKVTQARPNDRNRGVLMDEYPYLFSTSSALLSALHMILNYLILRLFGHHLTGVRP